LSTSLKCLSIISHNKLWKYKEMVVGDPKLINKFKEILAEE
jgi:hypothetical protein